MLSFPIFHTISRFHSFYRFLFCLFSCPLSLTAPVGTEYGNAIRTTESPSVCGKLNTLSNVPWGLGLQNREDGHGKSAVRQNAREQPKMAESVGSSLSRGIGSLSLSWLKVSKQYMSSHWAYRHVLWKATLGNEVSFFLFYGYYIQAFSILSLFLFLFLFIFYLCIKAFHSVWLRFLSCFMIIIVHKFNLTIGMFY